ncbi:hypothetical protein JCM3770_006508 [Rhodotorula araucariae]
MAAVLSSPTPSLPSNSAPLVTPPLLGSPELASYLDVGRPAHSPASSRRDAEPVDTPPSPASSAGFASEPSTPTGVHSSLVPAYPYNVAMAPAVFTGGPLPDDSELTTRLPSICVDYLSHDWAEDDVWTSWKAMTRHKSEIANGVRLENASWRTWAKQRGNLKTVSPETLNWLKDSDVTWLYGPLHTAVDAVPPPKVATANDRLGLEAFRPLDPNKASAAKEGRQKAQKENNARAAASPSPAPSPAKGASGQGSERSGGRGLLSARGSGGRAKKPEFKTKPILKYRSLSDILMPQGQPTSPVVEQLGIDFEDQATISVHHARSDSHLVRLNSLNRRTKRSSPVHSPGSSSPERTASDSSTASTFLRGAAARRNRRHISFNHRVEQCIAVDSSDDVRSYSTASSSDDDDDDVLTFGARSPRHSSFMRPAEPKEPHTILRLGPTTLKSVEVYPAPSPAVVFSSDPTEHDDDAPVAAGSPPDGANEHVESSPYQHPVQQAQQHAVSQRVMFDYSNPGSAIRSQWDPDDDDDYAMGFDYFTGASGPDLQIGDEYDTAQYGSTHLIGGSHNNYHGGSVGAVASSSSYVGGGPYAANSPYHPGVAGALDPTSHATQQAASQIPHYRDSLPAASSPGASTSSPSPAASSTASSPGAHVVPSPSAPVVVSAAQRGPHAPPPTTSAPKRSALKGGRSREASGESTASSASTSPAGAASPALSATASGTSPSTAPVAPVGIQAVATAIPAHVMRPGVRRGASDESERGRSASRGSSSSLEREASARRNSSSSISPTSYSPPGSAGAAAPIAIGAGWRGSASYDSLSSVLSGSTGGGGGGGGTGSVPRAGALGGSYSNLPDVPEAGETLRIGTGAGGGQSALGRLVTSSSVDSMGSLGSFGAGPASPTSPTMPSPARRYQPLVAEDDDDARVEDVAAVIIPATVDDSDDVEHETSASSHRATDMPAAAPKPHAALPSLPVAVSAGHARTPSGPVLRNPSPSAATTKATGGDARPTSPSEDDTSSSALAAHPAPVNALLAAESASGSGLLKRSPSSNSLSYARQSLLRATQRDESASRSSCDSLSPSRSSAGRASLDSAPGAGAGAGADAADAAREYRAFDATADDELGAAAVGGGINVAGTARDLLGAISKGIWGSLGGRSSR